MSEERAIAHFEKIRQDVRDEVKRRIEQRDKYSIQLTIALGVIVVVAFSRIDLRSVLLAAPLVSIYFTILILYSYRIHKVLAQYLREEIEPEMARLCGTSPDKEWETYYNTKAVPGIRRWFFLLALWVMCLAPLFYLWIAKRESLCTILIIATILYIGAALTITIRFWEKKDKDNERLAPEA